MIKQKGKAAYIMRLVIVIAIIISTIPTVSLSASGEENDLPWQWPVPECYKITALDCGSDGNSNFNGQMMQIDSNGFTGNQRLDVVSATSGKVFYIVDKYNEKTDKGSGFGNYVIVQSDDVNILYANLSKVTCSYGTINAGDKIGEMGCTGSCTNVGLRVYAYPKDKTYSCGDIHIFDEYIKSPVDYQYFEFNKELVNSTLYGSWIKQYYTEANGNYLKYSGGIDIEYPMEKFSVRVMSVNVSGSPLFSMPLNYGTYVEDTAEFGSILNVIGGYTDARGDLWLSIKYGGEMLWVKNTDVGFYDFDFSTVLTKKTLPEQVYSNAAYVKYGGVLVSENTIVSVQTRLYCGDEEVFFVTQTVNTSRAELKNLLTGNPDVMLLADGKYSIVVTATEKCNYPSYDEITLTQEVMSADFTVDSSLRDVISPVVSDIVLDEVTPACMNVKAGVSDNVFVDKVKVTVSDGKKNIEVPSKFENDAVYAEIDLVEAALSGKTCTVTVTAYDGEGNNAENQKNVVIPVDGGGEVWKTNEVLRVREGAGTGYKQVGTLATGATATITEVQNATGYNWGHFSNGWFALDLSTYVSGNLYNIYFDTNGGAVSAPSPVKKHFGESIELPSITTQTEGCEFLGWSTDSNSLSPEYPVGTKFNENRSVVLFAVWSDSIYPVIDSVTVSGKDWTANNVIITVNASDNSSVMSYSFDGGKTWQQSNYFMITENTVFDEDTIQVKDIVGNITKYGSKIVIGNIDREVPDISNATVKVINDNGDNKITISGITDSKSGIKSYTLHVSTKSDMSDEIIKINVVDGQLLDLEAGIYYAVLEISDNAGNTVRCSVERFSIGQSVRLDKPNNISAYSIGIDSAKVKYSEVKNADKYIIQISENLSFDEYITASSYEDYVNITPLKPDTRYFLRVYAMSVDGIYLPSDWSEIYSFVTNDSDNVIHSFPYLAGAVIDYKTNTISYTAPYGSEEIDITAEISDNSYILYFTDTEMSYPISNPSKYKLTSDKSIITISVSSTGGKENVYKLIITHAAQKAEVPIVDITTFDKTVFVSDKLDELSLKATVSDGGTLNTVWYVIYNDSEPTKVGEGESIVPEFTKAGKYQFYAVVTNINDKCEEQESSLKTDVFNITVNKRSSDINVVCYDYSYNGETPSVAVSDYTGDAKVEFVYYSDSECKNKIEAPSLPGIYYVVAKAPETDNYNECISDAKKIEITKCKGGVPVYSLTMPTKTDDNAYFTFESDGVEYRINGEEWSAVKDKLLTVTAENTVEVRMAESDISLAGEILYFEISEYVVPTQIEAKDGSPITVNENEIIILSQKVTVDNMLSMIEDSNGVIIKSGNGDALNSTDYVGTGCTIAINDGEKDIVSYFAIVIGDANGDGFVNARDLSVIYAHVSRTELIDRSIFKAVDLVVDGNVNATDLSRLYVHISGENPLY